MFLLIDSWCWDVLGVLHRQASETMNESVASTLALSPRSQNETRALFACSKPLDTFQQDPIGNRPIGNPGSALMVALLVCRERLRENDSQFADYLDGPGPVGSRHF